MSRTRIQLSLGRDDYRELTEQAALERLPPATLAARIIVDWLASRAVQKGARESSHAVLALMDWLGPHIDEVREQRSWPENVTVFFFELIEREALELYKTAKEEIGARTLNQTIGRIIRTRLEAEVIRRNGQPLTARVPVGTTSLIKTVTLLAPPS